MNAQIGHPNIIGVWVDKGDGDSTSPILDNSALFPGKTPSGFSDFIPTHKAID
jgi:hypothetical protein